MPRIYASGPLTAIRSRSARLGRYPGGMTYAERAFFDGEPCAHCAEWEERARLERKRREARRAMDRR
jgi:hypothetical protein